MNSNLNYEYEAHERHLMGVLPFFVALILALSPMIASGQNLASDARQGETRRVAIAPKKSELVPVQDSFSMLRGKVSPVARLGFQRMGMDLRVPMPFSFSVDNVGAFGGGSIVLRIQGANLWVGEAALDVVWSQRLRIFFKGSGNLMQRLALTVAPDLVDANTLAEWRKNDLRWIAVEGGGEYAFRSPFALIMGIRWDHFLLALKEPLRTEGVIADPQAQVTLTGADVRTDFLIPYAGIILRRDGLKAQVIGSLLAYSGVQFRTQFSKEIGSSQNVTGIADVNLVGLGGFFEVGCDYTTRVLQKLNASFWGKAGILTSHGQAYPETSYVSTNSGLKIEGMPSDRTLRFFRYNFTGGIAFEAPF